VLLILWEMAALLLVGLGIGTVVSLAAAQGAAALLFGLAPHDPPTLLASAGLLAAVAGFASFVPALRASRVDPMGALRHDGVVESTLRRRLMRGATQGGLRYANQTLVLHHTAALAIDLPPASGRAGVG